MSISVLLRRSVRRTNRAQAPGVLQAHGARFWALNVLNVVQIIKLFKIIFFTVIQEDLISPDDGGGGRGAQSHGTCSFLLVLQSIWLLINSTVMHMWKIRVFFGVTMVSECSITKLSYTMVVHSISISWYIIIYILWN